MLTTPTGRLSSGIIRIHRPAEKAAPHIHLLPPEVVRHIHLLRPEAVLHIRLLQVDQAPRTTDLEVIQFPQEALEVDHLTAEGADRHHPTAAADLFREAVPTHRDLHQVHHLQAVLHQVVLHPAAVPHLAAEGNRRE